ncbi:REP-associated tyrosine transposase [Roseisalinus antarcticus]|uniref:Transposase IS200-like domain-containing protein n=1 Tax=Roseisalinus antarcticus TaxID=254357 RepID=A0A1Y5TSD6_9RHOB|nr:transposase [Roseisalinus antarcticus]SLN69060.1 hypothetical protein ROA7023_03351 [Roseisalinus antarcticus]
MTSYRRLRRPGATYFFTVMLADPSADTLVSGIDHLRAAWQITCAERPFRTEAVVVLPDHLHAIWTLPPGDADFSTRWRLIKSRFSRRIGGTGRRGRSMRAKGERGIWQRRFWEHLLRDGADRNLHLNYCWFDPVNHGLVRQAGEWPWSSLHRDLRRGCVPAPVQPPPGLCFGERMGEDHPSYG